MLFHEAVAHALCDQGIEVVFGVLGDGNLYMIDSFQRSAGGRFYAMCHEAGGVLAANGYARTSGKLGVATVTHGPALTNIVTALVESVRDRTPLLIVAGDTDATVRDHLQDVSQRDVVLATGAGFEQVRSPATIAADLATAVRRALVERRPIVLNVPVEFQWREVEYVPVRRAPHSPQAIAPDPAALDEAAGLLAVANRPIVLAGQGAATAEARAALIGLAKRIGAPLATTLRGRDLFRGEPHDLGICGTLSDEVALDCITQADTVVAFGASLNGWTTAEGSVLAGKKVVHVDLDPSALRRFADIDVGVVGDVVPVVEAFVAMLDEAGIAPTGFASPQLADRLAARDGSGYTDLGTEHTVDIRTALRRVDAAFPAERTVVTDAGRFLRHAFAHVHVPTPLAFVNTVNFGSIGLGMGNAIGAHIGAPERPVLLVMGDGGFMLGGMAEFNSAVRHGVDLVVVVIDDGAYGAEHVQFRDKRMDPAISTFDWPELSAVATALGGRGIAVRNLAELDAALESVQERDRPVLIDVKVDPDLIPALQ
jgi:thiamine pyrophosphate-dependent acetolactate synthase large subunit-like protein